MKHFLALAACTVILIGAVPAFALDLVWPESNQEPDMSKYHVYMCKIKGCTATNLGALWVGSVPYVRGTVEYRFPIPANIEGAAVITAEDLTGNGSDPSNMVSFSTVPNLPPVAPSGLMTR